MFQPYNMIFTEIKQLLSHAKFLRKSWNIIQLWYIQLKILAEICSIFLCRSSISIFSNAKSNNTGWKVMNLPISSLKYWLSRAVCLIFLYNSSISLFSHAMSNNISWKVMNFAMFQLKITGWIWMNYDTYSLKYWLNPAQFSSMKLKLSPLSLQVAEIGLNCVEFLQPQLKTLV